MSVRASKPLIDMNTVTLSFMFNDIENTKVCIDTTLKETIGELKGVLQEHWPTNVETADLDRIRLICLGQMLSDDLKTLAGHTSLSLSLIISCISCTPFQ